MSSQPVAIPQTLTTMEACMQLAKGPEDRFWKAQEAIGGVVAAQPGFVGVIGGPIAHSEWMYFCGKFETSVDMDNWYKSRSHQPVMSRAHEEWFDAYYIRKWRVPEVGEALEGPIFSEISLSRPTALSADELQTLFEAIDEGLSEFDTMPFETLAGKFENQPFQLVGPLQEFPQLAPARYLVLTHWRSAEEAQAWVESEAMEKLTALGDVRSDLHVQIVHKPGERNHLSGDGAHRGWSRH